MERVAMVGALIITCLILIVHSRSVYARNESEVSALLEFKNSLDGSGAILSNWTDSSTNGPCDWDHLDCDHDSYVTSIFLRGVGIGGPINGAALAKLSKLNHLDLADNHMTGSIPEVFANISFTRLVLKNNRISGTIPCSLGKTHEISYTINLSNNDLEGCIPAHLVNEKQNYFEGNPKMNGICTKC